jgi:hypothetical protein
VYGAGIVSVDAPRKLRRYNRKDYSQPVDFPVEIVGRDGVVRRYSFEESVRLYQRRIASAETRYGPGALASAEVNHCQQRIGQLRRSYFVRYGWAGAAPLAEGDAEGLSGEVTAFLRRAMGPTALERVRLVAVEGGGPARVFVLDGAPALRLLAVYRFGPELSSAAREAFFRSLHILQVHGGGEAVERLIAFHHGTDLGLLLTGAGPVDPPAALPEDDALDEPVEDDLVRDAMRLLRAGRRFEAHQKLSHAWERNPWRRAALVGAVVLGDQLGAFADAETAGLVGVRHFPHDPLLHYHLALSCIRQGHAAAATAPLQRLQALQGDVAPVGLLRALTALVEGAPSEALRRLRAARAGATADDDDLRPAMDRLHDILLARELSRSVFVFLALGAALAGPALGPLAWGSSALLLAFAAASGVALGRQARALVSVPGDHGLPLAHPARLVRAADPRARSAN